MSSRKAVVARPANSRKSALRAVRNGSRTTMSGSIKVSLSEPKPKSPKRRRNKLQTSFPRVSASLCLCSCVGECVCGRGGQLAHANVHLCVCDLSVCFRRSTSLLLPRPTSLWFLKNETRGVGKSLLRDRVKFESVVFEKLQCFFPFFLLLDHQVLTLCYSISLGSQAREEVRVLVLLARPLRRGDLQAG